MRVVIGWIGRPHGVRGEVAVDIRTDEPERRFAIGATLHCRDAELTVVGARRHGQRMLVRFADIDDRTTAEELAGSPLEADVDVTELPDDEDAFYDYQLRGMTVVSNGQDIGVVTDIRHGSHQDTLVLDVSGNEVLVPFVPSLVPHVDVNASVLHVADIAGLLDPDQAEEA